MALHIQLSSYVAQHPANPKLKNRKIKPGRPSRKNEVWYRAELLRIVALLTQSAQDDLVPVVRSYMQSSFGDAIHPGIDAAFEKMTKKFGNIQAVATRLSREAVQRNLQSVDEQLIKHVQSAVGVNITPALSNDSVREPLQEATKANIELINSIPVEYFEKLHKALDKGMVSGARWETVAKDIEHVGHVTRSRAKLIGRDQTSKMNGAFNEARQISIGIEEYEWQTAGDERVRPTHAAHDGKTFRWDNPPDDTGNPGEDINCRCVALPQFDLDQMEAEP